MRGLWLAALLPLVPAAGGAAAQDRIVRADSTEVEARVLVVTPDEVRYRRAANPDGPLYVLPVGQIRAIRYANGEVELFGSRPAAAPERGAAAERPAPLAVGDWYERDGVRGIVCLVTDGGRHGLVLSPDETTLSWSRRGAEPPAEGGASGSDGAENLRLAACGVAARELAWSDLPALAWCRAKGEGWYLPSIDEWLRIGAAYHGGTRAVNRPRERARFSETLRRHGGEPLERVSYYLSSSAAGDGRLLVTHFGLRPPYVDAVPGDYRCRVRAVHRF